MTDWIDRRVVEPDSDDYAKAVFEGPDAEALAVAHQELLASKGISSQQFHQRHVLRYEPVRFMPAREGKRVIGPSNRPSERATMADQMVRGIIQICAVSAKAHGADVSPAMLRGELPPRRNPTDG